jgi:hypothetical protein
MRIACVTFCLLISVLSMSAADTKPLKDSTGGCVISVPANWTTGTFGNADSPDKTASLIMHSPKSGLTSLAQVRKIAPTMYPDDKVIKDSSTEFEMAGKSQNGKPNIYRAIPAGDKVCLVELIYENGDSAGAKVIVESMKPAK